MLKRIYILSSLMLLLAPAFVKAQPKKMVLQAFWWDFRHNNYPAGWANYLIDLAPRLKELGIDAVWIPNVQKNANPASNGYSPFDHYDLGDKYQKGRLKTPFGDKDELLRMVAVMHANGIQVIQDVVYNHTDQAGSTFSNGGQDSAALRFYQSQVPMSNFRDIPTDPTNGFKTFRYVCYESPAVNESAVNYLDRKGRWPKNWQNFNPNPADNRFSGEDLSRITFGPDMAFNPNSFGFATSASYNPPQYPNYNRSEIRRNLIWLKKQTGVDGWRLDAIKHYPIAVQEDFVFNTQFNAAFASGGNDMFTVGEWVGGRDELDSYVDQMQGRAGTFDFGLRGFNSTPGLVSMVYGMGGYDLSNIPSLQQARRARTVPFVNNHDTFRPTLLANGNYPTGRWTSGSELAPNIDPREPRLAAAYAIACAVDGSPQIFFEDLFDIGTRGNRYTHNPKSDTSLRMRDDIAFIIKAHQKMQWKSGDYLVPLQSADHLIIERRGRAIIGVTDNWNTWQGSWITTSFPPGTRLFDYAGSSGNNDIRTVAADGRVQISTPPCNGTARRRGFSIWAPVGAYNMDSPFVIANRTTSQEWELSDDLGDSHPLSLQQGGSLPARSKATRIAGKVFAKGGTDLTYRTFVSNHRVGTVTMVTGICGNVLDSIIDTGNTVKTYRIPTTGWYMLRARHSTDTVSQKQTAWINVTYEAPDSINALASPSVIPISLELGPPRNTCGNATFNPNLSFPATYRWTLADGTPFNSAVIPTRVSGRYVLRITQPSTGCQAIDTLVVRHFPNTNGFLRRSGDTLRAVVDTTYRYAWRFNDSVVLPDTTPQLITTAPGKYTLSVSSRGGCPPSISSIEITQTLEKIDPQLIWLAPNPAKDQATLRIPREWGSYQLEVVSSDGKVVKLLTQNEEELVLDLSNFSSGLYQLRITTGNAVGVKPLVVIR